MFHKRKKSCSLVQMIERPPHLLLSTWRCHEIEMPSPAIFQARTTYTEELAAFRCTPSMCELTGMDEHTCFPVRARTNAHLVKDMPACLYIRIHICLYIYVNIYTYTHIHLYTHTGVRVYMCINKCIYVRICKHIY